MMQLSDWFDYWGPTLGAGLAMLLGCMLGFNTESRALRWIGFVIGFGGLAYGLWIAVHEPL